MSSLNVQSDSLRSKVFTQPVCKNISSHVFHFFDCNIIHISLVNGVMRTLKRRVINLSFFF